MAPHLRSQTSVEKIFLIFVFGFVLISSVTFFIIFHNYPDFEMYLLRKRLSYLSDSDVKSLWKVSMGQMDRSRDLRRAFQDVTKSEVLSVFQHAHPRLQSLQQPGIPADIKEALLKSTLNVDGKSTGTPMNSTEQDDESIYMEPDKDIQAPIQIVMNDSMYQPDPNIIRILSWTWKYSFKQEWFMKRKGAFFSCNLPKNMMCEYTTDRAKYNTSNVVLFRLRLLRGLGSMPRYRFPRQKWLVYESESPSYIWPTNKFPHLQSTRLKKVFNLTSTYSMDSNIPFRGMLQCNEDQKMLEGYSNVSFTQNKTKLVAWFVSNCNTPSRREDYVKELQKFIPVDIYGECGPLKCGSQTIFKNNRNIDCYDSLLNTSYKFYLAFENSICKNYVTEKLWNLFLRRINIIPVVLGFDRYSDMVPRGTYLDVRHFSSPKSLADFMLKLDRNDTLMNMYLRKKASLRCISPKAHPYKCKLCEYLHKHKYKRQVVEDIRRYWGEETKCKTPEQFYQNIANLTFT